MTQSHGEMQELYPQAGDIYHYTLEESEDGLTFDLAPETQSDSAPSITLSIDSQKTGEGLCRTNSGRIHPFAWAWVGPELHLWLDGALFVFQRPASRRRHNTPATELGSDVLAPMPGVVLEIRVHQGDQVERSQTVVIMESMKMELVITASRNGIVQRVAAHIGQQVDRGALLLELAPVSDDGQQSP